MASLRALISKMAFEFAKLSCDHLEITCNQFCSDGALILGNNGIIMEATEYKAVAHLTQTRANTDAENVSDRVAKPQ